MDTLSRDSSSGSNNIMPIAAILIGVIGAILGGVGMAKGNKAQAAVDALAADTSSKISNVEAGLAGVDARIKAEGAAVRSDLSQVLNNQVAPQLTALQEQVKKLEDAMKKPAAKGGAAAAPTGVRNADGTYTIAAGDTLAKVAKKFALRLDDVLAENPGIDASRLRVGQKIKLPPGR